MRLLNGREGAANHWHYDCVGETESYYQASPGDTLHGNLRLWPSRGSEEGSLPARTCPFLGSAVKSASNCPMKTLKWKREIFHRLSLFPQYGYLPQYIYNSPIWLVRHHAFWICGPRRMERLYRMTRTALHMPAVGLGMRMNSFTCLISLGNSWILEGFHVSLPPSFSVVCVYRAWTNRF